MYVFVPAVGEFGKMVSVEHCNKTKKMLHF